MLVIYLFVYKWHGIRNLPCLNYHYIPNAKISAWHTELAQYLLNEFFNQIKYYLIFPLAFPVASLHTYSHFKSSFPHWFGQINTLYLIPWRWKIQQKCRWESFWLAGFKADFFFLTLSLENRFESLSLRCCFLISIFKTTLKHRLILPVPQRRG